MQIIATSHFKESKAAYKIRLANSSTGVGKSNGFRMLYYAAIGDDKQNV